MLDVAEIGADEQRPNDGDERTAPMRLTIVPPEPTVCVAPARPRYGSPSILRLLPAIRVAWADGAIRDRERELILALAEREGVANDVEDLARLVAWLETPPSDQEVGAILTELRRELGRNGASSEGRPADEIVAWARAVARSYGGVFGIGAINAAEKETLEWLESVLDPGRTSRDPNRPPRRRRTGTLDILRALAAERSAAVSDHVDHAPKDADSMWPRPCPRSPCAMPPAVFGIPDAEYREYMSVIVARYRKTLTHGCVRALRVAANYRMAHVSDAELETIAWESPVSRLFATTLDPQDEALFAAILPELRRADAVYKIDHSHIAKMSPLPGIHIAPTVALFSRRGDTITIEAMAVSDRVFTPGDGESWARSKSFFLQGSAMSLVGGVHSGLHFPGDSVIAVTREALPESHPFRRVIEAHAYLQLPLDHGVRWNPRSVAWNDQREVYTPFPTPGAGVFQGFSDHYAGIPNNSGFSGYRYPMTAPSFPGPYAAFLRAYYDVILSFCRDVAAHVDPTDPALVRWGAALHALLPGFPRSEAFEDREILARALAGFVHGASVWHSAEHHLFGELPLHHVPHRLRVPPPTGDDPVIPVDEWLNPADLFRQEMARHMFYEAHSVRTLVEVDYGFDDAGLRGAARVLKAALTTCDEAQPRRFIPLDQIACSIQF